MCAPPSPGTIGHVAHGKSTVVKAISGVQVSAQYSVYAVEPRSKTLPYLDLGIWDNSLMVYVCYGYAYNVMLHDRCMHVHVCLVIWRAK